MERCTVLIERVVLLAIIRDLRAIRLTVWWSPDPEFWGNRVRTEVSSTMKCTIEC